MKFRKIIGIIRMKFMQITAIFWLIAGSVLLCAADPSAEFPVEIEDAVGNNVKLTDKPERIVLAGRATLITANAFYLFEEARQNVAAVGHADQGLGTFLPYLDEEFSSVAQLPHEVGVEQILAHNPDLVIVKDYVYQQLGAPLQKLGIPVIALSLETPAVFQRDIRILGRALGSPQRAEEILEIYSRRMELIDAKISDLEERDKPRVLLLYYSTKGGTVSYNIAPRDWIQTWQVEAAGGIPVWAGSHIGSGWKTVNFEQIAAWDPDYIFVTSYRVPTAAFFDELLAEPRWQHLRAAKEKRILAFPADFYSWAQSDVRWVLGVEWLATVLHPQLFQDLDIREEIRTFYRDMYGLDAREYASIVAPRLSGIGK